MASVHDVATRAGTDKAGHGYTKTLYASLLPHDTSGALTILEFGVARGASLTLWAYLYPNARILGVDRDLSNVDASILDNPRIHLVKCDIDDTDRVVKEIDALCSRASVDIIIDDCSHRCSAQQFLLGAFFPFLKPGGVYFIEDLHTSFYPTRRVFVRHDGSVGDPHPYYRDTKLPTAVVLAALMMTRKVESECIPRDAAVLLESDVEDVYLVSHTETPENTPSIIGACTRRRVVRVDT